MTFKAEKQIQKEILELCKRWGLENHSFSFSAKGQTFTIGKACLQFLDHLSFAYLGKSIEAHKMEKSK